MTNTPDEIIKACRKHGARRVYDATHYYMLGNKDALPAVGLNNPEGVIEADHIALVAFKMTWQGRAHRGYNK